LIISKFVVFLTLTGFEPTLRFVDHINAAFATHNAAITVPVFERAERVLDLHWSSPVPTARASAFLLRVPWDNFDPKQ